MSKSEDLIGLQQAKGRSGMSLNRRNLMKVGVALSLGVLAKSLGVSLAASNPVPENSDIQKITKTDEEWKALLTPEQYHF